PDEELYPRNGDFPSPGAYQAVVKLRVDKHNHRADRNSQDRQYRQYGIERFREQPPDPVDILPYQQKNNRVHADTSVSAESVISKKSSLRSLPFEPSLVVSYTMDPLFMI